MHQFSTATSIGGSPGPPSVDKYKDSQDSKKLLVPTVRGVAVIGYGSKSAQGKGSRVAPGETGHKHTVSTPSGVMWIVLNSPSEDV